MQQALPAILDAGGQLVAITPELPDNSLTSIEKHGLQFQVLTDRGNALARKFGLVFELAEALKPLYASFGIDLPASNGDDSYELPLPATYVVNQQGILVFDFVDADYTKRGEPVDIIAAIESIS